MHLFLKLFIAALLLSIPASSLQAQTNYNLDFEIINPQTKLPAGWGFPPAKGYTSHPDSAVSQTGKYSILIEKTDESTGFGLASYYIKASFTGKKLKLTGYVKTENVTRGNAALWLRVDDATGKTLAIDNMDKRGITGTTGWTQYTLEADYDEQEAVTIYVGGFLTGAGKMWLDNLQLTVDGEPLAQAKPKALPRALTDTVFNTGSGIQTLALNKAAIDNLTNLGMLWGFLKYHHPAIAKGNYNWDAELFRVLPKLMAAGNQSAGNKVLEEWVDAIGKPDSCPHCPEIKKDSNTKLLPDYGNLFTPGNLSTTLINKLAYIKNNRNQADHFYIGAVPNTGNPEFKHENAYAGMLYPDAGYRLLALYRYWNMIQYFFPYKYLVGEDWNKVLPASIPEFTDAKDTVAYHVACLRLIARIHDSHAAVYGNKVIETYAGVNFPTVQTRFIDGKLLITGYYSNLAGIKEKFHIGDEIAKINKIKTQDLVKQLLPETPASNYEQQLRELPKKLLRGYTDQVEVEILRAGKTSEVMMSRFPTQQLNFRPDYILYAIDSSYKLINTDIGYLFTGKYKNQQLPAIKELFKNTKGIIVDMRCYPSEFMPFTFGSFIKPATSPFAWFSIGSVKTPGLFTLGSNKVYNGSKNPDYYKGKIVVIVNAVSISQAEYTTMAFQSAPNVTVIGSTTAGADGNVSGIVLPGNISTGISGLGVYYPDGSETQRKGIRIDVPIKPTIQGIIEGRDELLEKAIELINKPS